MKTFAALVTAAFVSSAAVAQTTTVIEKDRPAASVTIEKKEPEIQVKRTETTGSIGCETKTTQKTDTFGDSKTKTETNC